MTWVEEVYVCAGMRKGLHAEDGDSCFGYHLVVLLRDMLLFMWSGELRRCNLVGL